MALEPGFNQVLRFGQNNVVRRTLVSGFAHHDAILRHKTSHIVDMAIRMVAMQTVGEHQHIAQAKSLAKSPNHLPDILHVITVLTRQTIQRGNAEAVAVDFNGSTFKNVGNACTFLVFENISDAFGNLVVVFPRRKFCTPGVKNRFGNNRFFPFFQEERTIVANPDIVRLDGKETGREGAVGNSNSFRNRQKILFRNQHIHGLKFADCANQIDIEPANHFSTFTVPILFIMRKSEPGCSLFFPFSGVANNCFCHI